MATQELHQLIDQRDNPNLTLSDISLSNANHIPLSVGASIARPLDRYVALIFLVFEK